MSSPRLQAAILEFTSTVLNPYDLHDLLRRVTDHAAALTDAQGAGIMLAERSGGLLGFAAASSDRVVEIEITQDRTETGPCHDAFVANRLRVVEDLDDVDQWPEYEQRALQLGFRSVLGVPMTAWGETIGVVDIYREAPGPWSDDDIEAAVIVTAIGAGYLLHADQIHAQHELTGQLQSALERRDLIGQAKGILMARHGVDAEAALEQLHTAARDANVNLLDVAQELVGVEVTRTP